MPNIQRLSIDQQLAAIGVHITPAKMNVVRPRMQMTITTESPHMEIERKNPSFKVNRKKINTESGLKPPSEFANAYKAKGKEGALRGSRTPGEEGNFLGDIRKPGNKIAQLSRSKSMAQATRKSKIDLGLMPKSSPEVIWDKGSLSINWSKHSIVIDWDGEYMPQVTIDPKYSIEVFLRTEPYFRVAVEDVVDPSTPGRYVDQAV